MEHPRHGSVSDKNICAEDEAAFLSRILILQESKCISNNIYCIFTKVVLKSSIKLITKICTGINLIITL